VRLTEKVVVITGAGQGIGEATAFKFAHEGACVVALDRNQDTAQKTAETALSLGSDAMALTADVGDEEQVRSAFAKVFDRFSRIDVLVNNAGFDRPGTLDKLNTVQWEEVMGVHLRGCLNCSRLAVEAMKSQRSGSIVNISSIYGKIGAKGELAYCTAKAGLIGLTKSMARELGPHNIRVNVVLPGLTETPTINTFMKDEYKQAIIAETPLGRLADPKEIANVIAFLASDEASFMTGAVVEVSGGWGM
jgi:3-oxoacyl-[acyl-carrier protein] reductase